MVQQAHNNAISIHAPLAGSDTTGDSKPPETRGFQSTLPLRGATSGHQQSLLLFAISIHAPLAGSDCNPHRLSWWRLNFNPRSPCGERPVVFEEVQELSISIHAPLAGSDRPGFSGAPGRNHFNPRSPCGERQEEVTTGSPGGISIHAPLAGSDRTVAASHGLSLISIHAPLAGSDSTKYLDSSDVPDFNPRSPCGERQREIRWTRCSLGFQSTLPLRGATSLL